MANETKKLRLRRGDLKVLESWVRSRTLPRRQVERAQMLLAASHGESSRSIAEALGVARDTARLWIRRYGEGGLKSVAKDRERAGRPRKLTPALEEEIVAKTVSEKPPPEKSTHWSSRLLADEMGLNHVDVWRTWSKFGLKPHKVRRFKPLSRTPAWSRSSTTWWACTSILPTTPSLSPSTRRARSRPWTVLSRGCH